MTLEQMRYFFEAAKYQSVTKAGASVRISPSAVSTAISKLEDELGCALFRREGKIILLTDAGRTLQREVEKVFEEIEGLKAKISSQSDRLGGEFRLGASPSLSTRQLASAWTELMVAHAELKGELVAMHTAHIMGGLLRGDLDFGLCFSPQEHPELTQRVIHQGQLRVAVRKGHPLLKLRGSEQLKALARYPAAVHKGSPGIDLCQNHPVFSKFGVTPDVRLQFDGDDQALSCVARSEFWALVPDICVSASAEKVVALPWVRGWDAPYKVVSVVPKHRRTSRVVEALEVGLDRVFRG